MFLDLLCFEIFIWLDEAFCGVKHAEHHLDKISLLWVLLFADMYTKH